LAKSNKTSTHKHPLPQAVASIKQLRSSQKVVAPTAVGATLDPKLVLLRTWQMERLAQTHADLLSSKRYGQACRFFLSDLYAPGDFSRRNEGFKVLYHSLRRYLPPPLLRILTHAITLNELTQALDDTLLSVLVNELGMTDQITPQLYAEAYRRCANYEERVQQINQLVEIGQEVDRMVRLPFIGLALRVAHGPAHRAGWGPIQDFLERGHAAFKQMNGADEFLQTISARELQILDRIYTGHPEPFALPSKQFK